MAFENFPLDPRFDYRRFTIWPAGADASEFVTARESEGWELYLRHTVFDLDDNPDAIELRFRKKKAPTETTHPD